MKQKLALKSARRYKIAQSRMGQQHEVTETHLELQSLEERCQLSGQIGAEDQRLTCHVQQRQRRLQRSNSIRLKSAPDIHGCLPKLRMHLLGVALQLCELQICFEIASLLLHLMSGVAQRRQCSCLIRQLPGRLSHTLWRQSS